MLEVVHLECLVLLYKQTESRSPLEWEPLQRPDFCGEVFETPHPYAPNFECYKVISFPGAPYIRITFSDKCDTEFGHDFVSFFKGLSLR